MGDQHPPTITSFVIRFVLEEAVREAAAGAESAQALTPYRGSIRHVQSDETLNFSMWQEAVEFIRRYVPLESHRQG
jgi:hypothetical protein